MANPGIEITPVAKVMDEVLPRWKQVANLDTAEAAEVRDELIAHNESLGNAFYKHTYTQKHIDWDYAVELIHSILYRDTYRSAKGFAEELNVAVQQTASQRDFIAVIPLGFPKNFGFPQKSNPLKRPLSIGSFKLSSETVTVKELNKVLKSYGGKPVAADDFYHQRIQSHHALGAHPILTFEIHGSPDALRLQPDPSVRRLIWLIELLGRVFYADKPALFGRPVVSHHIFLSNRKSGDFLRIPSLAPLTLTIPLSEALIKAIKQKNIAVFLELLSAGGNNTLSSRLRNALSFFGRAVNERDALARFLFFVIAMEAIFSRDKSAPIKSTLADNAAVLCYCPEDRLEAHADIRKVYDARSMIVHSGRSTVDKDLLLKAERLAARAIYCSLALAVSLPEGTGKMEDRFFERLLEIKIGTATNTLSLPPWIGYARSDDKAAEDD